MRIKVGTAEIKFYPKRSVDGVHEWFWIETDVGSWKYTERDWPEHKQAINSHVKMRRTCIQAGGNLGMYPRLLSRMFQTVYTFEPDPTNFYVLSLNNPAENVLCFQAALGEKPKMITVDRASPLNVGETKISADGGPQGYIPTLTIDSFSWENGVDLIFLDVEGYENRVLNGATRTIKKFKPVIIVEAPDEQLIAGLTKAGYGPPMRYMNDALFLPQKSHDNK